MNKQAFSDLIKEPQSISKKDIEGLDEVIANFPYCQAAHILLAKVTSDEGKMMAGQKVRKAGAYILERKKLRNLLFKKDPITPEVNNKPEIQTQIPDIFSSTKKEGAKAISKSLDETFYEELQRNLRTVHESKVKAATESPAEDRKQNLQENNPEIKKGLIPENIKEHSKNLHLFSSRLDEVMASGEVNKKSEITEAELLLNYLTYLKNNKISVVRDKKKTEEIIDKFIKEEPSIASLKSIPLAEEQEDKASESSRLKSNSATETLANMMVLQHKYEKAIEIYQELMLKYPEKRTYFVTQIEKIKEKNR
jgi:hypothetical protein